MSNLTKRVLAGIAGVPLLIAVLIYGGTIFLIFTIVLSCLALWEFYGMFMKIGYKPMRITMTALSALLITSFTYPVGDMLLIIILIVAFTVSVLVHMSAKEDRNPMNVALDILGLIYIGIPLSMLAALSGEDGTYTVLMIFVLIWTCDTFAYFGGKLFGKKKLSSISPGKTLEGSLTGFVSTLLVSLLLHSLFGEFIDLRDALVFGTIAGTLTQAGDLFESMLKRYCGVKDSSRIIPGHGGVLDRFDGLMTVVPFIYIYVKYLRDIIF